MKTSCIFKLYFLLFWINIGLFTSQYTFAQTENETSVDVDHHRQFGSVAKRIVVYCRSIKFTVDITGCSYYSEDDKLDDSIVDYSFL